MPLGLMLSSEVAVVNHVEVERFKMSFVFFKHVLVEKAGLRLGCFIGDDWIVEAIVPLLVVIGLLSKKLEWLE